jgi:hypothetical protein
MADRPADRRALPRLLLEGVVVVASILIAFGLDAWWADVQLTREVAEELDGIDRELEENVVLVQFQSDMMRRRVAASRAITAPGRLQAIRLPELRVRLAGLRGIIEDALEEPLVARDLRKSQIRPRISASADLRALHDIGEMDQRILAFNEIRELIREELGRS